MSTLTKSFKQLSKLDVSLAGGKGASLGEMTQAGILVPPGFVVLASVFDRFCAETDLGIEIDSILHKVDHKRINTVEDASENIKALILNAKMPGDIASAIKKEFKKLDAIYVAVRSSATAEDSASAAWAGQLESYLNTTEKDLLQNVQKCWASLFTPRAIFYRFEKGLHGSHISVAVVVQKMVQSEVSGIAFSVHPVTEDRNQLIIEAGFGLGEAIVSGQITPDSYVVEKEPRRIIDKNIAVQTRAIVRTKTKTDWIDIPESKGAQQALSDKEILQLTALILRIEEHYGFPCDIEWAREKGKFYIVQSRPITTLKSTRGAKQYKKTYTRENCLIAIQIWEKQQCELLKEKLDSVVPFSVFDAHEGVVGIYYDEKIFDIWGELISNKANSDPAFVPEIMKWYGKHLDKLEAIWKRGRVLSVQELADLFDLASWAWVGLSISYFLPSLTNVSKKSQNLGMALRERSADFLELTDHTIQNTLHGLYPDLGDLVKYLAIEEVKENALPSVETLQERQRHYIYFGFRLYTNKNVHEFVRENAIVIEEEKVPMGATEFAGQTAMGGKAQGRVRILRKKSEIPFLQKGEILATAMTTPDYLPAMRNAVAFITDEGGITCHAAIVARELGKPCIIGTKIATQVLKDGDLVEVDANHGIVKILKRAVRDLEQSRPITTSQSVGIEESLEKRFLNALGEDELFKVEGDFLLLLVAIDWFNYYDEKGKVKNVYPALCLKSGSTLNIYWSLSKYREVSKMMFRMYLDKKLDLKDFHEKYHVLKHEIDDFYHAYYISGHTDESALLAKLGRTHTFLREIDLQTLFLDALDQRAIEEVLKERSIEIDLAKVWRVSHILDSYSFHTKNKDDILASYKKRPESLQYVYSNYVHICSPSEVRKKVRLLDISALKGELEKNKKEAKENLVAKRKEVSKLSPFERKILVFVDLAGYLRDDRKTLITKCDVLLFNLTSDLYKLWGIRKELVPVSLVSDVLKGRERIRALVPTLTARLNKTVLFTTDGKNYKESMEEAAEEIEAAYQRQHAPKDASVLRGESASTGLARGRVRVIIKKKDFYMFRDGEILVAAMTRPEFVPLMKKAKAIVTDEGGITSHAAIVSRELGKPCIIGTRVATKLLKDGDLVEVDAERGVVRILEKKPSEVPPSGTDRGVVRILKKL
ncbi:MAG: PEP/pyruvate-binding domain-containing protein [bacterium]|nr:PEP/pyruvate-binding domain-containing protein [bacterium]